jgi:GTPase SAR1 family protein
MSRQTLYLVRGLPGSGKSSLMETLLTNEVVDEFYEADQYIENNSGEFKYTTETITEAHRLCYQNTVDSLLRYENIGVSNTFVEDWELQPYLDLAKSINIKVICIVVENRHNGISIHQVPPLVLDEMKTKFTLKL